MIIEESKDRKRWDDALIHPWKVGEVPEVPSTFAVTSDCPTRASTYIAAPLPT